MIFSRFIKQRTAFFCKKRQPGLHGVNYTTRSDGRTGKLIKITTVFFNRPFFQRRIA
jgi:hypothetical protein